MWDVSCNNSTDMSSQSGLFCMVMLFAGFCGIIFNKTLFWGVFLLLYKN